MTQSINRRTQQTIALSFLAGYVDTLGFIALFGLFTAHVTGNFVLIGRELANPSHGVLIKFMAFPAFIFAVALTRMAVVWLERAGKAPLPYLLLLQLVLLLGFMGFGYMIEPVNDTDAPLALLAGMFGAASMGVQNANSRLTMQHLTPTTVMTGNVTQLVIDFVDVLRGVADDDIRKRCIKFFWPVVAFGVGAICGAFGYRQLMFLGLLLPAAILAWLCVGEYLAEKSGVSAPSTL